MVRTWMEVCAAGVAVATVVTGASHAAERRLTVASPPGALGPAIVRLATQYDIRVLYPPEMVAGRIAPAVNGQYTAREALQQVLSGSGLEVYTATRGVLVLRPSRIPIVSRSDSTTVQDTLAQTTADPAASGAPSDVTALSEIVVGSHLRGRDRTSLVITIGQAEIDRGGFATIGDVMAALPQTFSGTASDKTVAVGADSTGTNSARSTGVNLRGLGADATLVLVNGRRMPGAGLMADFADVSSLPLAALERIEVLPDGASALYGSDAVGGVINIVMRDRWQGLETRARVGGSTQGDLGQRQLAQTWGKAWRSGSLLLSAEYQRRDRLQASDRAFTANADMREFGGADYRSFYSQPGNVLVGGAPVYAIPSGQDGTALTAASFLAGQINRTNQNAVMDILPSQERFGVYASATQDLTDKITLNGEIRYADRRWALINVAPLASMTVTRANPYFASPTGAASTTVAYSFQNEAGGYKAAGSSRTTSFALGAKADLFADWRLDTYVIHGEELSNGGSDGFVNTAALAEALGNAVDSPVSAYSAGRDGYFNPFIGAGRNKQAVLDFVLSGRDTRQTIGKLDTASATADGTLFRLPAGAVRLAVGAQIRTETLKTSGMTTAASLTPVAGFFRAGERTVKAVFAETRVPLFGGDFTYPGLARLELSAAVRRESYDGGWAATTPKYGVAWAPVEDLTLRATYGESFRAPSIGELTDSFGATPVRVSNGSSQVLVLILYGGNPDLRPETAKSWTAGFEFAPRARPELKLSATLFKTEFESRIGRPAINYLSTILTAPDLAPFRTSVAPATNASDLALVKKYLAQASASAQALYAAEAYGAIGDARYVNAGAFMVKGLDLTGSYQAKLGEDPLVFSGNLSWLMAYKRKITQTAASVELVGTAGQPADLRARVSAAWTHGPTTATFSLNHTGDLYTEAGLRMDALNTADLQVQWAPKSGRGVWRGTSVALTVQNLFNQDPPFYASPQKVAYDPANHDPSGRVVALQLIKAW